MNTKAECKNTILFETLATILVEKFEFSPNQALWLIYLYTL